MPIEIVMPKLGITMTEGSVVSWFVQEGDPVRVGMALFEVESDKANHEITAQADGVLARILVHRDDVVPVGQVIAYLLAPGESATDLPGPGVQAEPVDPAAAVTPVAPAPAARVSPAARKLAKELGVDLAAVAGSGPLGRVVLEDIRHAAEAQARAAPMVRVPMRGVRRTTAERMHRSLHDAAQLTLFADADVTDLVRLREQRNADRGAGELLTFNDLFIYCTARTLTEHPALNARLEGDEIVQLPDIHIGLAVDTPRGLLVPVIRDAGRKGIGAIAQERARLLQAIQANQISPDDLTGSTFTLTNLGAYGVDGFTPILNPPECAILGIGRIAPRVVVRAEDNALVVRRMVTLSLTFDHRLVDGAPAARFLAALAGRLAAPPVE